MINSYFYHFSQTIQRRLEVFVCDKVSNFLNAFLKRFDLNVELRGLLILRVSSENSFELDVSFVESTHLREDRSSLNPSLNEIGFEFDDSVQIGQCGSGPTEGHEDRGSLVERHIVGWIGI
jgi:hypothetical protein